GPASSATSTAGTDVSIRCASSAAPGSGSCSSPRSSPAPGTSSSCARPPTASVVDAPAHAGADGDGVAPRSAAVPWREPISIYELHVGSWRRDRSYVELGEELGAYVRDLGFTHVELMPVMEHPFAGSWGYQVTGFYAPTARFGSPDDFRALVDALHRQ